MISRTIRDRHRPPWHRARTNPRGRRGVVYIYWISWRTTRRPAPAAPRGWSTRRGSRRSFGSSSGIGRDVRGRTGFADRLQCSVGAASAGWAARWAARRGEAIGVEPRAWPRCSKAAIAVAMQPPLAEIDESSSLLAMIRIEVSESHISQTTLQSRVVSVEIEKMCRRR